MALTLTAMLLILAQRPDACSSSTDGSLTRTPACIALEIGKLGDRAVSMGAVEALSALAPESISPLRYAVKSGETPMIRANAADALGRIGPKPPAIADAVEDLIAALKDTHPMVRR